MAGSAARLFIEIGADVKGAVRGIDNVSKQLKSLGQQASAVRNIAIAATGVVAIRKAADALGGLAQRAADEQAGQLRLQRAIANTGQVIDSRLVSSVEHWLSAQEEATGFADTALRDALAGLVGQTGDLEEAQSRLTDATDLARGAKIELAEASQRLGRVDEESLGRLESLMPGITKLAKVEIAAFDAGAAAAQLAERAHIDYGAALAAIKKGGPGLDSVLMKHGIETKKMAEEAAKGSESYIDVQKVFAEVRRVFGGQGADFMKTPAGDLARARNEAARLSTEFGANLLPMYAGLLRFGVRAITAVRRAFSLFTTDVSGPKLGSARKMWKAAFGEEMPGALSAIVDLFGKLSGRLNAFIAELGDLGEVITLPDGTTIESGVQGGMRGAIRRFVFGVRDDIRSGFGDIGAEFDKLGLLGGGLKLLLLGTFGAPVLGGALNLAAHIAQIVAGLSTFGLLLVGVAKLVGPAFAIGAIALAVAAVVGFAGELTGLTKGWESVKLGVMGFALAVAALSGGAVGLAFAAVVLALYEIASTIGYVRDHWDTFVAALKSGALNDIPFFGFFFRKAQDMLKVIADVQTTWNTLTTFFRTGTFSGEVPLFRFIKDRALDLLGPLGNVLRMYEAIATAAGQKLSAPPTGPPGGYFPVNGDAEDRRRAAKAQQELQRQLEEARRVSQAIQGLPGGSQYLASDAAGNIIYRTASGQIVNTASTLPRVGPFGHGGGAFADRPTLAMFGDKGPETAVFTPGRRGAGVSGGAYFAPGSIVINGDIDSDARVQQIGREFWRKARALGLASS